MKNISPYYAVKCNPDRKIVSTLADLGANFDCASPNEIELVLNCGVSPDRIIYANPCKKESDIKFANLNGIRLTTFDSICELEKIAKVAPIMNCVLRIFASDTSAQCVLSNKYGALPDEIEPLLVKAQELKLKVIGISFHVGSGAKNPEIFNVAISECIRIKNVATNFGHEISIIDIGGGFTNDSLISMSKNIQSAIKQHLNDIEFIAEPGRYFAETVATLYTKIINIKQRTDGSVDYWLTDGLYGSFNSLLYDHADYRPVPLYNKSTTHLHKSTLWGPTCDGFDKIGVKELPILSYGEWLVWRNAGAYTIAGACDFNGVNFTSPYKIYL